MKRRRAGVPKAVLAQKKKVVKGSPKSTKESSAKAPLLLKKQATDVLPFDKLGPHQAAEVLFDLCLKNLQSLPDRHEFGAMMHPDGGVPVGDPFDPS